MAAASTCRVGTLKTECTTSTARTRNAALRARHHGARDRKYHHEHARLRHARQSHRRDLHSVPRHAFPQDKDQHKVGGRISFRPTHRTGAVEGRWVPPDEVE